jgi:hypothetical protein
MQEGGRAAKLCHTAKGNSAARRIRDTFTRLNSSKSQLELAPKTNTQQEGLR